MKQYGEGDRDSGTDEVEKYAANALVIGTLEKGYNHYYNYYYYCCFFIFI